MPSRRIPRLGDAASCREQSSGHTHHSATVTLQSHRLMHHTSAWKPSQPVAFAWVLCLLMLGGELFSGGAVLPAAEPSIPGGWSKARVDDKAVVDAAAFAIKARQKAMKAAGAREVVELVRIARARQQVVAGMNYHLTLQVKRGDVVEAIDAVVWVQPWLAEAERSKLTSWKVLEDADAGPDHERKPEKPPQPGK